MLYSVIPASTIGFRGCLSGCISPICQPLLIAFWIPFLVFETSESSCLMILVSILIFLSDSGVRTHPLEIIYLRSVIFGKPFSSALLTERCGSQSNEINQIIKYY